MNATNLWGDISVPTNIRTPKTVLVEQAQILSNLTKNMLVGHVETSVTQFGDLVSELFIIAPFLNNYHTNILHIFHKIESSYPAIVRDDINWIPGGDKEPAEYKCENEDKLKQAIADILQSNKVQKVIAGLLAESIDYSSNEGASKIWTSA